MPNVSLEISGPDAAREAAELRAVLTRTGGSDVRVGPVEVERSAELVVAVVSLAFSGVTTAKDIWEWWQSVRRGKRAEETAGEGSSEVAIRIVFEDGTRIELPGADRHQLEVTFEKHATPDT